MDLAALILTAVPSLVLMFLVGAFRRGDVRFRAVWVAIGLGVVAAGPISLVETVVEGPASGISDAYLRVFVQQVLGAAVTEELFIFAAFLATYLLFRRSFDFELIDIVILAVSAAIGFTTIENIFAYEAAADKWSMALDRLMSIVAGHATLQLIMGYFAALALFDRRRRVSCVTLMFAVPMAIHGWGDFAEAMFQYEANLDPDSRLAQRFFSGWIFGLFAYFAAGVTVLWQVRQSSG